MRKFIKLFAALLIAVLAVAVSGCSARTPVTAESFQKLAESQGLKVSAETSSNANVTKSLNALKEDNDTRISFLTFSDNASAQERYAGLKKLVSPSGGGSSVDSSSYNKYVATNGELYYAIVRLDNTILYCQATVTHKDDVDNFIKAIKY